jgi:hypothetical protein
VYAISCKLARRKKRKFPTHSRPDIGRVVGHPGLRPATADSTASLVNVSYPVYDALGTNFPGTYYDVASFATVQATRSLTCPFPPCINPLARPIRQLGSINVFESAASSVYHGATLSIRRRMSSGCVLHAVVYFAHAIDDGQDALVAGQRARVQNSYAPNAEKGSSVTDQRQRLVLSCVVAPKLFHRDHEWLGIFFNNWKASDVVIVGSGRPVSTTVTGDANQDGNNSNDRLPGCPATRSLDLTTHYRLAIYPPSFTATG